MEHNALIEYLLQKEILTQEQIDQYLIEISAQTQLVGNQTQEEISAKISSTQIETENLVPFSDSQHQKSPSIKFEETDLQKVNSSPTKSPYFLRRVCSSCELK